MKFRPIIVDETQQELTQHGTEDFPMSMDEQIGSSDECYDIPHWHHEIQISLVTKGSVLFQTAQGDFVLHEGEGLFVNSGVIHSVHPTEDPDSVYICVNFLPNLIYGQLNNLIRKYYVDPVLFCAQLQTIVLNSEPWHKEICECLRKLAELEASHAYGYEISAKMFLCQIWQLIVTHNRTALEENFSVSFADRQRIKMLKTYIHKNYMEKIGLSDIANAGYISRSECCRLFKRVENTTPILYLKHYRITESIKFLTCTDLCISDIAHQTGFSSSSYYAESFRNEMGCTPLEYRKQHRE